MATHLRCDEPTPSGGAYSEIFFFDAEGKETDETKASRCVIRECSANRDLIKETWGFCEGAE